MGVFQWPEPPIELPVDFVRIVASLDVYMWHAGMLSEGENALTTAADILEDVGTKQRSYFPSRFYQILGVITSFEGVSERERSMNLRHAALASRQATEEAIQKTRELNRDDDILRLIVQTDLAYGWVQEEDFSSAAKTTESAKLEYQKLGFRRRIRISELAV